MKNLKFLYCLIVVTAIINPQFVRAQPTTAQTPLPPHQTTLMDPAKCKTWLSRWQTAITGDAKSRDCDKAMGEEREAKRCFLHA